MAGVGQLKQLRQSTQLRAIILGLIEKDCLILTIRHKQLQDPRTGAYGQDHILSKTLDDLTRHLTSLHQNEEDILAAETMQP